MSKRKPPKPDMNTCLSEHNQTNSPAHIANESDIKSPTHIVDPVTPTTEGHGILMEKWSNGVDGEYIKEWLVLGPFFPDDLSADFLADLPAPRASRQAGVGGEANIEPIEGDTVTTEDGRILKWKRYKSKTDIIDLLDAVGAHEHATAYAFCVLRSEVATDARIYLGSDDGVAVWINGEQVYHHPVQRPITLDEDIFEADLKAGANRCLLKVSQVIGDWGFAVRMDALSPNRAVLSGVITDEAGQPIPSAAVRLERDGEEIAEARTDASGSYRLDIYPVRGQYDLSATSGDLGDWQLGIRLREGERQTLSLTLKEAISIEGTLLMLDDVTPHVAVPVQAIRDGKVMATTLSDEGGIYRFINLKTGQYQVRCQVLGGYIYYSSSSSEKGVLEGKEEKEGMEGLPSFPSIPSLPQAVIGEDVGEILQVEEDKTLEGIDFRFAPFKKGTWKNYTYLDGLADNEVIVIHRDSDGIMWFGTRDGGVSRYDGKEFKTFTTQDGLAHNEVFAIHQDSDGVMWFGTRGGVSVYAPPHSLHNPPESDVRGLNPRTSEGSKGGFVNITKEDGLANNWVFAIHRDSDGVMWFGTGGGGVSRYDGKEFKTFTKEDGLAHNFVRAISCNPDGTLWFGTFGGISRYDGRGFLNFTTEDGLANNVIYSIYCHPDGVMWFGTESGISRYDGEKFVNFTTEDGLASNEVRCIHCNPDGTLWFGTFGGGVSVYAPPHSSLTTTPLPPFIKGDGGSKGRFVNFAAADGLANHVYAIYRDEHGAMWFGTLNCGVFRYDEKEFETFTTKDGLAHNDVNAIHRSPDGMLWFGSYGGVSVYNGKRFKTFTTKDGLAHNWVFAIHRSPDGMLWFGTYGGVSVYNGKRFKNFTTKDGLGHNFVSVIHGDPDGVMWFGTYGGGVSRYDGNQFKTFTTENGLARNDVTAIHCEPDGVTWFGTSIGGVSRYDGNQFKTFTIENGLAHDFVCCIHCAPDGTLWFGTRGGGVSHGVYPFTSLRAGSEERRDRKEFPPLENGSPPFEKVGGFINFTTKDGLANNKVLAIYAAKNGVTWLGTLGGGVAAYDGIAWTSLDTRDGLASNVIHAIHPDADGSLWFATQGGITRYRRSTIPPQVNIVSVTTDHTRTDLDALPAFTVGTRITIEYNSIDFVTVPEKRQYRCRIYESANEQINQSSIRNPQSEIRNPYSPPTKDTTFDWVPEKPGAYTFQVQAIDRDLNYSSPATLILNVQPDPALVSMKTELNYLRREVQRKYHFDNIIGRSDSMKYVYALMEKAIDSGLTVLISGETGTGKELIAKAIHYNSPRRNKPILPLNCGAETKELIASKLFGHCKGAFTDAHEDTPGLFEAAEGGTVLLDEIGEMPEEAQVYLLRVLQEHKIQRLGEHISRDVNVRVIAMTNRDLLKKVESGRFREDLYYRVSVFPIHLPSLRERVDDIPLLAEHFLKKACREQEKEIDGFAPEVMDMLVSYPWPGNVRELENEIARAVALVEEDPALHDAESRDLRIQTYHFSSRLTGGESLIQEILSARIGLSEAVERLQRRLIENALQECGGNRSQAARMLGIHQPNLVRLMKRLNIE